MQYADQQYYLLHQGGSGVREPAQQRNPDDKGHTKRWAPRRLSLERRLTTPKSIAVGMQLGKQPPFASFLALHALMAALMP
jgi:hypothetical protein